MILWIHPEDQIVLLAHSQCMTPCLSITDHGIVVVQPIVLRCVFGELGLDWSFHCTFLFWRLLFSEFQHQWNAFSRLGIIQVSRTMDCIISHKGYSGRKYNTWQGTLLNKTTGFRHSRRDRILSWETCLSTFYILFLFLFLEQTVLTGMRQGSQAWPCPSSDWSDNDPVKDGKTQCSFRNLFRLAESPVTPTASNQLSAVARSCVWNKAHGWGECVVSHFCHVHVFQSSAFFCSASFLPPFITSQSSVCLWSPLLAVPTCCMIENL